MSQAYDKLIRDHIPHIIRQEGRECVVEILTEEAYRTALRHKLVEEASEARDAKGDNLVVELADLKEVVDALLSSYGITVDTVHEAQQRRRAERGGFTQRLRLVSAT